MAGLDPAIQKRGQTVPVVVDARHKAGHDGWNITESSE
jgi:hypothetical protein